MTNGTIANGVTQGALDLAARNWRVVPLYGTENGACECQKGEDCPNPGKHPRITAWQQHATSDEGKVAEWGDKYPRMNVGIQLGEESGIFDIECDSPEAEPLLHELFGGEAPITPTYQSRRGKHRLFRWRNDLPHPDKAGFKIGTLEFRTGNGAKGQQSVFPPSRRADGGTYTWLIHPDECDPAPIDSLTLDRIREKLGERCGEKTTKQKKNNPDKPRSKRVKLFTPDGQAEGGRDEALYHEAVSEWGDKVRGRGMKVLDNADVYAEVLTHLQGINATKLRPPFDDATVRQKCDSALSFHRQQAQEFQPFDLAADDGQRWVSIRHDEGRTDAAFARRLLRAYGDVILWVPEWKLWLVWDGCRWKIDTGNCAITRFCQAVSDSIWHEVAGYHVEDAVDYATKMASPSRWASALKAAAAVRAIAIPDLNANRWLIPCPNGTLDLRSGELRPHRKEDLLTTLCPTPYDADAPSYSWDRFLEGLFPMQPMQEYLQRLFGYALAGRAERGEEILPTLHGDGCNGKSVLIGAISGAVGTDFATAGAHGLLTEKSNDRHATERASLYGKRLVWCTETGEGARLDEDLIKSLTGGDRVKARFCFKDEFEFEPTFTIFLVTNHRPIVRGTDYGIWRRLNLIPFGQKFWREWMGETGPAELKADPGMREKLATEHAGILAWMVRGCRDWHRDGLNAPEAVRLATAEYRSAEDTIGQFVAQNCISMPSLRVRFNDFFAAFEKWCEANGEYAPKGRAVGAWLQQHGYKPVQSSGRWYIGLALSE